MLDKNISVVIPVYNSQKTIYKTLKSIIDQTKLNYIREVIIVDDGSTDNSVQVINSFIESCLTVPITLISQPNRGASAARNAGIKLCSGEWIALLDSDDKWRPNKIELQAKIIDQHPEIDFLGCNVNDIDLKILWHRIKDLHKATIKELCIKNFPATPTILFKKKITNTIGYFDENQLYAEDGNYYMKICRFFNFYHMPVSLVDIGCGKPPFGYSGLSANLKGMYDGNIKNIRELKEQHVITPGFYWFLRFFYWVKYLRRIVISKSRGILNDHYHQ